ncbi:hypothetical protein GCM10009799_14390 [Nocardiopsis rhodophaea]|uniref:Uncharacterized protein n=1 Tax=Nocardiopsis rhodophaea TaxID=280238 RepID=A0ABN2SNE1_9ACTN
MELFAQTGDEHSDRIARELLAEVRQDGAWRGVGPRRWIRALRALRASGK